ncbi:WxL domain-containing protein [Enterococcus faecalis]|nr:WxL domain-containing protein [Enterococcus faecalis]EGO2683921.1 WxL domain-containing protein [Enterococcus faecalis]EGO8865138.1 WxL domain-containing protein [Enterococcus faecalis]
MKQTKWQRLATIGLCSSLVINAFSGVTAVAETITIESSPIVASSAKEATSASSATPESTESSQETTETSREEVTQETVEQEDTTEIAQEENLLEPSGIQAKIMPRAFVWAATGTTNRTTVRLNDVVDYRMKLENITTDDTNSDIVGPIRIESKLAAGMTRPTSVIIKVGPEEQNVVIGEGSHNANSGGEYFVWTESTRTVTAFINRLHGRTSGNTGYIKTLYFQTRITSGTHNEKKYIDSTIRFNGFGAVNRRNEMTYVDRFSGNLGLKGNLKFYDEDGVASKEQMSLSINPVLFKSTNSRVEGTLLRYPLTMTNAGSGLYRFDTGLKNIGTSNGGSWFFFSNDIAINFATATTNRIDKIVLAPPKATLPDSRTGVMTSRAYTSTTYTRSNYDISTYNFTKATGKTWRITNRSSNSGVSTNIMFSDNLVGTTGQFNKGNSGATINYYIYYKKLYENFVNSNGQKITPPSGFTQGKRTVINSEAYTFKQSGTLPDTYQADGKTYKFKGWYKGKTKPNTLTTTKAPSYAVTYNNDDDLTVVYEEIEFLEFPSRTYQFGFVDESGKRVDASTIDLTYDNWYGIGTEPPNNIPSAWATTKIETGIKANTKNNLKEIIYPVQSLETSSKDSFQFSAVNLRYQLPRIYKSISIQNQQGGFDAAYPYPSILNPSGAEINNTPQYFELKNNGGQEFVFNRTTAAAPENVQLPFYLRYVSSFLTGRAMYYTIQGPIYYYLTNRRVTENFVDTNGTKITPPTGFTQGKQTVINSDPYTFKQSGTLPETYKASNGKTYKFKGWYKGKTKPDTLTTTKAPSYAVTYDGNDDLTVVYEAIQEGKGMSSVQVMNKAIQNPVTLPDRMYRVLFINETGGLTFADRYGFTGELVEVADGKVTPIGPVPTNNNSAVKEITIPGRVFDTERPTPLQYGVRNATFTLPKMYKTVTYQPGPNYTGTAYSIPETYRLSLRSGVKSDIDTTGWRIGLDPTTDPQKFTMSGIYWSSMPTNVRLATLLSATITGKGVEPSVYTLDENARMYLYLENRRVTENFVDTNGTKITAPSGFAQGKKTVITSDSYTFKQSGDLPDTYKVGTKTYQFKGWYKGKNKPDTLTTTKAPSYPVTYNDDDDLTVVYEEVVMKTYNLPAKDVYFGYVDEAGNLLNTAGFSVEAELGESDETESTVLGKIQGTDEVMSKLKKLSIPGKSYDFPIDKLKTYGARSVNHTIPKQYKTMSITPLATYTGDKTKYPMTKEIRKNIEAPYTVVSQADGVEAFKLTNAGTFFRTRRAFWTWDPNNTLYAMGIYSGTVGKNYNLASPEGTIYYYLENRRVTENFVDPSGAKITPPTGFTQGKQTVIDSDNFTYASTKALPDTYTTGDKSYKFKGWYKGKTKPGTLTTTKTPSYAVTYDDKDDMTAVYEEVQPTAEMTVSRLLEVIPNEASMMWIVKLKNTSEVPLTNVKLAPTAKWAAGISPPTQLAVRIGNTPNKIIPVTAEQWQAGVNLDIEIPVNGEALVTVNTAKITGEPRQLLTAEMTASGNFSAVTASNFVRIQGEDQTITPTPVEEGFISTPTFDFGKITINSSTKQYGLKKAADYYGNGTRNPYLRIKTSQPNWQLTAQLSQLTASADSLPTSTRLLLGSADVIAIENYNQVTELTNKVGVTKALTLTSDGTSTPVILNNQFTGNDVYQLDFDFANVKLEVPANQGKINEKYQGTVTWNLVTGP